MHLIHILAFHFPCQIISFIIDSKEKLIFRSLNLKKLIHWHWLCCTSKMPIFLAKQRFEGYLDLHVPDFQRVPLSTFWLLNFYYKTPYFNGWFKNKLNHVKPIVATATKKLDFVSNILTILFFKKKVWMIRQLRIILQKTYPPKSTHCCEAPNFLLSN